MSAHQFKERDCSQRRRSLGVVTERPRTLRLSMSGLNRSLTPHWISARAFADSVRSRRFRRLRISDKSFTTDVSFAASSSGVTAPASDYHEWALSVLLCHESEQRAAHDPLKRSASLI